MEKFDRKAIRAVNADAQVKLIRQLQAIRKERNIQVSDVAEDMGVDPTMVYRFERGGTNFTAATLRKYAKAVGAVLNLRADMAPEVQRQEDAAPEGLAYFTNGVVNVHPGGMVRATLTHRPALSDPPVDEWRALLGDRVVTGPVKGARRVEVVR